MIYPLPLFKISSASQWFSISTNHQLPWPVYQIAYITFLLMCLSGNWNSMYLKENPISTISFFFLPNSLISVNSSHWIRAVNIKISLQFWCLFPSSQVLRISANPVKFMYKTDLKFPLLCICCHYSYESQTHASLDPRKSLTVLLISIPSWENHFNHWLIN